MPISLTTTPIITPGIFRQDYPEFASTDTYPDSAIAYWIAVASILLIPSRWCNLLTLACELFVAHNLVLEAQDLQTAADGGWPGISKGAISGETAGKVSLTYDVEPTLEEGAGNWNLTKYGTRLYRFIKMAGMGPIQISNGCGFGLPGTVPGIQPGTPYSGPNCLPGFTSFSS